MEEQKQLFTKGGIKQIKKEEKQVLINPKLYHLKEAKINKNNFLLIKIINMILLSIIIILILYSIKHKKIHNINTNSIYIENNNYSIVYNKKNINNDPNFTNYQNMLPHLSPDLSDNPKSIEEIFNARQIYISDVRITPDYIKYIRPINETEELKYKKPYSQGKTIIDRNIFKKRNDQYNYIDFCKLNLNETLIDDKKIEYDNRPIISVILPSYNKKEILLKSVRSIQNQNFKNIEIIIVNDCSTDDSSKIFNYLLKTDPRIRIFHHMTNMGCWRSRLNGILYSRGKYIILFDTGDLYEDNYVLTDAFNVIEKYNLDSCKFLFRIINSFKRLKKSVVYFHVGYKAKIVYETKNIWDLNKRVFSYWGNIFNRLVRANILTKGIMLLNELMLNIYKNVWDDKWFNKIIHMASYSYAIFERVGYVYLQNGQGEGSPRADSKKQKSNIAKEYVGFLYYNYNFYKNKESKVDIINKLRKYDKTHKRIKLKNFRAHFEVLNNLLEALIKDPEVTSEDKKYCEQLLKESKIREKNIRKN